MGKKPTLGDRIRKLAADANMSFNELAQRARLDRAYLGRVLKGETANPGIRNAAAIAGALGVSLDYLVAGSDYEPDMSNRRAPLERIAETLRRLHVERIVRARAAERGIDADEILEPLSPEERAELEQQIAAARKRANRQLGRKLDHEGHDSDWLALFVLNLTEGCDDEGE